MADLRYMVFLCLWSFFIESANATTSLRGHSVYFHGTVSSLPCSIAPGSDKILVDFKDIAAKDLYLNTTSSPVPFSIRLSDCTTDVFNSVTVTFSGDESDKLPNHLAIRSVSPGGAAGVGVGLQLQNGRSIKLNEATPVTRLSTGNMSLGFSAVLQGEPDALKKGAIQYGPFTAMAHYTLHYQ